MEKDAIVSQKTNDEVGKTYLQHMTEGTLISYSGILQIHNAKLNPVEKKMGQEYEFQSTEEEIQRAHKYMESCSTLLVNRKMPIRATLRCHFPSIRLANIKKTNNYRCW